jgi:hypothetical protein
VGGLERLDAHALVAVAHEQLHRLARLDAQPVERRASVEPARDRLGGGVTQPDQAQAEREAALVVAAYEPVRLERDRQPVGGGP